MKTELYFQILSKELEIQAFHSQGKTVYVCLEASVEVRKDKGIEDNIKKESQGKERRGEEGGQGWMVLQGLWQIAKKNT